MLTREQFLAPIDLERVEVPVPELGDSVFVRAMTAGERDRFESEQLQTEGRDFRARLATYTVCDAAGVLLFTPADVPALSGLPASTLSRVADAALKLNSLSAEAVDAAEKNSVTGPSSST